MSLSIADRNSASGLSTTADKTEWENSRPIAAPICASSLAEPSRSSRAINEAWRLAGTVEEGGRIDPAVRSLDCSLSASRIAFVISSTNSGMPSVRSMMSCLIFWSSVLSPATRSIIAAISRRPSLFNARAVTYERPIHGGSNSVR